MEQPEILQLGGGAEPGRSRRGLVAAGCLAATLALGAHAARPATPTEPPVDASGQPRLEAGWWPGGQDRPRLRAGTYELPLDRHDVPFTALVTVPGGWRGWYGPERPVGSRGYVAVLLLNVLQVVSRPCQAGTRGMAVLDRTPAALVEALTRLPGHRVTVAPHADQRFGVPGTHLRVRGTGAAACPQGAVFELWNTTAGLVPAVGPHARMDLWVVDLHRTPVLVAAVSAAGTPGWALHELDRVVASVDLDQG